MSRAHWAERRVLVTGATGLVGSWLVKELLRHGAQVVAFIRDYDPRSELMRSGHIAKVSVVSGALEDFWAIERAISEYEVDTVFHLAAQAIVGVADRFPLQTFESNIRGSYNLLEACRIHARSVQRVVIASSDKAYGAHEALPYTEDMPLQGRHPYEVSKSCTDLLALSYHHSYGLPVGIARCGNIYGGGDLNWSRIVPGTIRSNIERKAPIIRSDGTYVRDYIYVKDVVAAYLALADGITEGQSGEAFNFSPETRVTVLELVQAITNVMGGSLAPVIQDTAKGEIRSQYLSSEKARQRLRWRPNYSLEAGLAETVDWYREFLA